MEKDPTGRGAHDPGAKVDAGKARMGLVLGAFATALKQVAKVGTFGAKKYSDNGWMEVPNAEERYMDALLRHVLASHYEDNDPESGYTHMAHAAWNCLAIIELKEKQDVHIPVPDCPRDSLYNDDRRLGAWTAKVFDGLGREIPIEGGAYESV